MIEEMESEGKSVTEAVEKALKQLGVPREQVEVQILQEASSGILGFGAKPARVKVTRKHWGTPTPPTEKHAAPRGGRERSGSAPRSSGDRAPRTSRPEPRREPRHHAPAPAARAPQPPQTPPRPRPEPARQPMAPAERDAVAATPVDPAKACAAAEEILKELLGLMYFTDAGITTRWDPEQERVKTNVRTAESDRIIGEEGKVLESLQFLMTLMVSRRLGSPVAVQVDTNDYWQKKENEILSQVLKGVETVRNTGKPFRMQPMEPPMRRLVHKSLANHPDIMTSSEGDGPWRKVVLRPKQ